MILRGHPAADEALALLGTSQLNASRWLHSHAPPWREIFTGDFTGFPRSLTRAPHERGHALGAPSAARVEQQASSPGSLDSLQSARPIAPTNRPGCRLHAEPEHTLSANLHQVRYGAASAVRVDELRHRAGSAAVVEWEATLPAVPTEFVEHHRTIGGPRGFARDPANARQWLRRTQGATPEVRFGSVSRSPQWCRSRSIREQSGAA